MVLAPTFVALLLSQGAPAPGAPGLTGAPPPAVEAERHPPIVPALPLEERAPDGDGAFVWQMVRSVFGLIAVVALI